jgi:hypothetical protein
MKALSYLGVALSLGMAACGSTSSTPGDGGGGGADAGGGGVDSGSGGVDSGSGGHDAGVGTDSGSGGNDSGGGTDGGSGNGSGTVSGSGNGTPFPTVASALWFGKPDSAATTVVYVFSKHVDCSQLTAPAWDSRITNGTLFIEMKEFGLTPKVYTVTGSATPAPGEASVNHTVSSTSGTPVEGAATGGTVTLTALNAGTNTTGSFALQFGANNLTGTFDAAWCANGVEP